MQTTIKHISQLNTIYHVMKKQFESLKKIFRNHTLIKQKIILSEQFMMDAYKLSASELKEIEEKREFNKIIKGLK